MTLTNLAADPSARAWADWSERTGRPLVFVGDDITWCADDYPDNPYDHDGAMTAARLVELVDRGEIDDRRALELAEELCEEDPGERRARAEQDPAVAMFAEHEQAAIRRGHLAIDESSDAPPAGRRMFDPITLRAIAEGRLYVDDTRASHDR